MRGLLVGSFLLTFIGVSHVRGESGMNTIRKDSQTGNIRTESQTGNIRMESQMDSSGMDLQTDIARRDSQMENTRINTQMDTIRMDEVILSGKKTKSSFSEVSRMVATLQHQEIQSMPSGSITGVLEDGFGMDIRNRGVMGVQADMSIRGGSFDQNLILLNGISINDPQTGHHNLNIPVNLSQVKKIEVLHGPGSRIFGANAFSGAVNIITMPVVGTDDLQVNLSGGQHAFFDGSASLAIRNNKLSNQISLSNYFSDGYTNNTDFNVKNLFYQGQYENRSGAFNWQVGHLDKGFGANSFYTPAYPNQYEKIRSSLISLGYQLKKSCTIDNKVYYRRHQDRFELFRSDPASWYGGHNHHITHVAGVNTSVSFSGGLGETAFGLNYKYEKILSNVLGIEMNNNKKVPGEENAFFSHRDERNNIDIFAEHSFEFNKWLITGGALFSWNNAFGSGVYPGLEISYSINQNHRLFGSVNRSLRLPTFTDLYYEGPTNNGNPDLKPETALNYEIGAKWIDTEAFRGQLALFQRHGKDIIDWVRLTDSIKWQSRNLTTINTNGLEINLLVKGPGINLDFIEYIRLHYAYVNLQKSSGDYLSNYALDFLKHKFGFHVKHHIIEDLSADWNMKYFSRAGTYLDYATGKETSYKPVFLADARIAYQINKYTYFISVSNILDAEYQDIGNIEMPGRWIKGGIRASFDLFNFN